MIANARLRKFRLEAQHFIVPIPLLEGDDQAEVAGRGDDQLVRSAAGDAEFHLFEKLWSLAALEVRPRDTQKPMPDAAPLGPSAELGQRRERLLPIGVPGDVADPVGWQPYQLAARRVPHRH